MKVSRRGFLKITGATTGGAVLSTLGIFPREAEAQALDLKIKYAKESTTICPYCGVGCSEIVSVSNGKVINIEGDPDHPINQGALCSKGQALIQVANNERRMTKVLYRAPYSDRWEEKSWDWALPEIAKRIKKTRDENWMEKDSQGRLVNRCEALAGLGGAALDNEECYLWVKLARALGIVYLEHQARI
ncbi:MAG: formate dehydrogenase [candidate division Zixibacteria bacterium SM23_73_2]|nr:MAG: formate dehydrogenase [candidate division Zixibacteria bacterium SM23_73_2]